MLYLFMLTIWVKEWFPLTGKNSFLHLILIGLSVRVHLSTEPMDVCFPHRPVHPCLPVIMTVMAVKNGTSLLAPDTCTNRRILQKSLKQNGIWIVRMFI